MKRILLLLFIAMATLHINAADADYNVVPLPQTVSLQKGGAFVLDGSKAIVYGDATLAADANFLAQYVAEVSKLQLSTRAGNAKAGRGNVFLTLDKKVKSPEGYTITVNAKGVTVAGQTPAGVFYGVQTLRKSLPILAQSAAVNLPAVVITDAPRFAYRGMMLDCARHFFPVEFVKEFIDLIALHNMNRFHWHLSDDQGWRIEIKKFPKLTEVGAWRSGTVMGHNSDVDDGQRYGGFYTQEEIRDVVKYAAERHITIIPEIDMPGHMQAALAAYPELGCNGGPYEVGHYWGVYSEILCAGNPKTYDFVKGVLDEVCTLFPSEYIHIGGDESPRVRWEQCPKCQAMITEKGITAKGRQSKEARLQGYFATEVQKYLENKGRKLIGWDELLECDVDNSATIMSWRGAEPGAEAAKLGHDVIMSPNSYLYFDYYQTAKTHNEPLLIGGNLPIERSYSFEPVPANADAATAARIIGVQANLWTEYIPYTNLVEYQVLPRMSALSEIQWMQPDKKNFEDFKKRVNHMRDFYQMKGWTYAKHLWPELYLQESKKY